MTSSNDLDFMVRRTCQKQAMVSGCHESKPSSGSSSTPGAGAGKGATASDRQRPPPRTDVESVVGGGGGVM